MEPRKNKRNLENTLGTSMKAEEGTGWPTTPAGQAKKSHEGQGWTGADPDSYIK